VAEAKARQADLVSNLDSKLTGSTDSGYPVRPVIPVCESEALTVSVSLFPFTVTSGRHWHLLLVHCSQLEHLGTPRERTDFPEVGSLSSVARHLKAAFAHRERQTGDSDWSQRASPSCHQPASGSRARIFPLSDTGNECQPECCASAATGTGRHWRRALTMTGRQQWH
jgi:hypothetical protein